MKISSVLLNNYKRFTNLKIQNIPESVKLIIVVGPNGSGKSSIFDAFNLWYRTNSGHGFRDDMLYHYKNQENPVDWGDLVDIHFHHHDGQIVQGEMKDKFYFRTAYRNESDFTIRELKTQSNPTLRPVLNSFIQDDLTVSSNYQRLISLTLSGVYDEGNDSKTVKDFREELIGRIRNSLRNVFDELNLSDIGDPLSNGSFYFEKGTTDGFHYKNLSAGEKSAFDIILDLIIKSAHYPEAIYCIDEPEAHMHTKLQSDLLEEIFNLVPNESQLWIATHSIGMLKKAKEIEDNTPGSVAFIDFNNIDFDSETILQPTGINKTIWNKFVETALDDFSNMIAPETIVFCEGTSQGRKYRNFDAVIYSKIFEDKYTNVSFTSIGSSNDLENDNNPSVLAVQEILKHSRIIKIVDRDDKSDQEIEEIKEKGINVLKRRHLESYLLDDEIISKLCVVNDQEEKIPEALNIKVKRIQESVERNNPNDDIKSASGPIFNDLKSLLNLTQCGNTKDAFLRDTMAPLITDETAVYKELEKELFIS